MGALNERGIALYVRVRQHSGRGAAAVTTDASRGEVVLRTAAAEDARTFTFDGVGGEATSQEEVFEALGRPLCDDACMLGYNATCFAYGQTGAGKTYTMYGPNGNTDDAEQRGLTPRVLDHLFARMAREERVSDGTLKYNCSGSFLQIYNERIIDLLEGYHADGAAAPSSSSSSSAGAHALTQQASLKLREDARRGVYVENITQEHLRGSADALRLLAHGVAQRAVGTTAMNASSSRSHLVFTLSMEAVDESPEGVKRVRTSQFHLVDLAGSERQRDTHTSGTQLSEACSINRSLSALGNVITALTKRGDASAAGASAKGGFVPYRDSKLTHLLKDSLGGNAKTCIIACVSAAEPCVQETLSTLKFAQRAKLIKNKATINEDTSGSAAALQQEIARLKAEIEQYHRIGGLPPGHAHAAAAALSAISASPVVNTLRRHGRPGSSPAAAAEGGAAGGAAGELEEELRSAKVALCEAIEAVEAAEDAKAKAEQLLVDGLSKSHSQMRTLQSEYESVIEQLAAKTAADGEGEGKEGASGGGGAGGGGAGDGGGGGGGAVDAEVEATIAQAEVALKLRERSSAPRARSSPRRTRRSSGSRGPSAASGAARRSARSACSTPPPPSRRRCRPRAARPAAASRSRAGRGRRRRRGGRRRRGRRRGRAPARERA